ncbi:hypothetical protein HYV81_01260 [Candidatus Woesearchaeota archaeon]|nr:hypothetical protein [Candidatus Woesearchaeota archaeon]
MVTVLAEDGAGNKASRNFTVTIDTTPPSFAITNIPPITKQETLMLNGTVNEPVNIEFFVSLVSSLDFEKPARTAGLQVRKVEKNKVELAWNKANDSDVHKYVIYRDGLRLTFAQAAEFIDSAVDTATTYQYEVTALDDACNEGDRSDVVEARTMPNGSILKIAPKQIELPCREKSSVAKLNTSNRFKQQIAFALGLNEVEVVFTDLAGNTVSMRNRTLFNNKPPKILSTNLHELTPSYSAEVTIIGKVSEQSRVLIFVNNGSKPDAAVDTAPDGSFKADVSLSRNFLFSSDVNTNAGQPQAPVQTRGQSSFEQFTRNDIRIVAVNNVGLQDEVKGFINYALCGGGGDWEIEIPKDKVFPTEIIPRYLIEGFAQIGFGLNFTYRGLPVQGREPSITSIRVTAGFPQSLSAKDRKVYDEDWVSSITWNRPGSQKSAYVMVNFKKLDPVPKGTIYDKEKNLSEHNKGKCFNVPHTDTAYVNAGCVNVPLTIEIMYPCESFEQFGDQFRKVTKSCVQKQCTNVNVVIVPRIPPKVIPKDLLREAIKLLDSGIALIDKIIGPLQTATQFTLIGCFGTWGAYFASTASEYFSCINVDFDKCSGCADSQGACTIPGKENGYCRACYNAKLGTAKVWEALNYVCDRIMCPAVPSYEKYRQDQVGLKAKFDIQKVVTRPNSNCRAEGAPLNAKDAYEKYSSFSETIVNDCKGTVLNPDGAIDPQGKCCAYEYKKNWDPAVLCFNSGLCMLDPLKESACRAKLEKEKLYGPETTEEADPCGNEIEKIFRTVRDFSLCGNKSSANSRQVNVAGDWFVIESFDGDKGQFQDYITGLGKSREEGLKSLPPTPLKDKQGKDIPEEKQLPKDFEEYVRRYSGTALYTGREVIYRETDKENKEIVRNGVIEKVDPIYVQDECCTKGYNDGRCKPVYKRVTDERIIVCIDKNAKDCHLQTCVKENCKGKENDRECNAACLESAKKCEARCQQSETGVQRKVPQNVVEMFCTGNQGKDYVIDPTADVVSAVQSGCMTGTLAYLNKYRTIMAAVRGCFQTILETGDGSAGMCREVISIYICDLIYYAINCIKERMSEGSGVAAEGLPGFLKYVTNAGSKVQGSIQARYGATSLYRALFVERSLIHSACLFAFTGDWDISFNNVIQQITTIPIEPTITVFPADRRFLSYDTTTGLVTHVYHLAAFIVPGADNFRYRMELVCSNKNDCDPREFENSVCDCARAGGERVFPVTLGTGFLRLGQTLNDAKFIDISGQKHGVAAAVRYDRVRVTYSYKDNKGETVNKVKEFRISQVGGQPPVRCQFDVGSASFRCSFDMGEIGIACILNEPEIYVDNKAVGPDAVIPKNARSVQMKFDVQKTSPDKLKQSTFYAQLTLIGDQGQQVQSLLWPITQEDKTTVPFDLKSSISRLLSSNPSVIYCSPIDSKDGLTAATPITNCKLIGLTTMKITYDGTTLPQYQYGSGRLIDIFTPAPLSTPVPCKKLDPTRFNCDGMDITLSGQGQVLIEGTSSNVPIVNNIPQRQLSYKVTIFQPDERTKTTQSQIVASCNGQPQIKEGVFSVDESIVVQSTAVAGLDSCSKQGQKELTSVCACGTERCGDTGGFYCCSGKCVKQECNLLDKLKVEVQPGRYLVKRDPGNILQVSALITRNPSIKEAQYALQGAQWGALTKKEERPDGMDIWESNPIPVDTVQPGYYTISVNVKDDIGEKPFLSNILAEVTEDECQAPGGNGLCARQDCGRYGNNYISLINHNCPVQKNYKSCCQYAPDYIPLP